MFGNVAVSIRCPKKAESTWKLHLGSQPQIFPDAQILEYRGMLETAADAGIGPPFRSPTGDVLSAEP